MFRLLHLFQVPVFVNVSGDQAVFTLTQTDENLCLAQMSSVGCCLGQAGFEDHVQELRDNI